MVYIFLSVIEAPGVEEYLKVRQLTKQYKKARITFSCESTR
jgi:hypothetical protein